MEHVSTHGRANIETEIPGLNSYQKFVVAMLAFLQFTIVLDFMILSPLGAVLMPALNISASQFGLVVSGYAFSAGASGLLAAGFADRFDRKKLLLFFYTGFVLGTFLCGIAPNYPFLLGARIITGLFGGVIGSISFAIITDLFPFSMRGRVMGIVQTSFAASQVLGIPLGLFLSNHWGWHMPFMLIVGVSIIIGFVIFRKLKPIDAHLKKKYDHNPFHHLMHTISKPRYLQGFATTALLSTGGFMLMPFGSAFNVNNLGMTLEQLPMIYMVTGGFSILTGPLVGRFSDKFGKYAVFLAGSLLTSAVVYFYTRMDLSPLWAVMLVSVLMFAGVSARIISSSALLSALPAPADRGAYMSVSSSLQQISGGIGAALAGMIVAQTSSGKLEHFDRLGNVVVLSTAITIIMMWFLNKYIQSRPKN